MRLFQYTQVTGTEVGGHAGHAGRKSTAWRTFFWLNDCYDIVSFAGRGSVVNVLTKSIRKVVPHWAAFGKDLHSSPRDWEVTRSFL